MSEEWRPIPGFEGLYEVSNLGRVMSFQPPCYRYPESPRLIGGGLDGHGYRHVHLQDANRKKVVRRIHGLVMLAFVGPAPEGHEVRHLNGDRTDARLVNLAYGTRQENINDRTHHGTWSSGVMNKTHCKNGHELSGENVEIKTSKKGWPIRKCLVCKREGIDRISKWTKKDLPTHCKRGHEFTPENTYIQPNRSGRICRECQRQREREFYARHKGEVA